MSEAATSPVVFEPAKDRPVLYDVDVVVAGSGLSGSFAAIAAGRCGARTLVVERFGSLGGNLGPAMVVNGSLAGEADITLPGGLARSAHEIGNTFAETRQWKRAMQHYREATELAEAASDSELKIIIRMCVAELERRRGAPKRAVEEALAVLEMLSDDQAEERAFAAHNLSLAYLDMEDVSEFERWNQRSLAWAREAEDPVGVFKALRSAAIAQLDHGSPHEALALHDKARRAARDADLLPQEVLALQEMADVAWRTGDDEKAEESLQEAVDLSLEKGNWILVSETAGQASVLCAEHHEWEQAGKMLANSLVFAVIGGMSTTQRHEWQQVCMGSLFDAGSVKAVDEFKSGAQTALSECEGGPFDEQAQQLRALIAEMTDHIREAILDSQ